MPTSNPVRRTPPPLTDIEYYILIAILTKPRHGIGIFEDVARFTENQLVLSPGTLYAALKRMFAAGWVIMVDAANAGYDPDERRKIYLATDEGARVVEEKAAWFEQELGRAHAALLERSDTGSSDTPGGITPSPAEQHPAEGEQDTLPKALEMSGRSAPWIPTTIRLGGR